VPRTTFFTRAKNYTHPEMLHMTIPVKFDVFTAHVHDCDDPVPVEKKRGGHFTWSALDRLAASAINLYSLDHKPHPLFKHIPHWYVDC